MKWNKILFAQIKEKLVSERRELLSQGKIKEYEAICTKTASADEENLQKVITIVLKKVNIEENVFQSSLMSIMQDPVHM